MDGTRWDIAGPPSDEMRKRFPELHPVTVQMLWNRGITTQEEVDGFLELDYGQDLHDPFLFRQMEEACARVWRAIQDGEKVVVHGDYDADGVTGSVVLMTAFRTVAEKLGKDPSLFSSYIPHRENEGYGVREETVRKLADGGATLLITVDCGISCAKEIATARSLGMDTIIVDHHQFPDELPECVIVHPLVPGETYPFKHLAAVGVAFKLACGFFRFSAKRGVAVGEGDEKWLLDLVAIATVTDFMPLIGENRTLEKYGLVVLNKTRRKGLRKICEVAGLEPGTIDTQSIGFGIGPRINAASRMEHAELAFRTLMAETDEEAARLAEELDRCNRDRRRYTDRVYQEALAAAAEDAGKPVRVVLGEGWSAGIVGLVAGKLVSELGVPVFVLGKEEGGERIVGSGRSIHGFDVVKAMDEAAHVLARYGGHPQACGLTIMGRANFDEFKRIIEARAERELGGTDLRPALSAECELRTGQMTWELIDELERFEPFGEGNPKPLFVLRDLLVSSVDVVGKTGTHARIGVRGDTPKEIKMIAFGLAERMRAHPPGSRVDALVEVGVNQWNGTRRIQARVIDVRAAVAGDAARIAVAPSSSRERAGITKPIPQ